MKTPQKARRLRAAISAIGIAVTGAAVIQELRKPAAERVWHGRLWDRVPYEFRLPTIARLRQAYWAPDDPHLFTDTPFGVGWSVNVGRLVNTCTGSCTGGKSHAASGAA